ncbi:MAG TPA: redox-sensing transcriptional repressor Rex, partial [Parabacteroides sp.]|nr:redox-sensing transcriptional repressor Rex [Parabacteroides sp.]
MAQDEMKTKQRVPEPTLRRLPWYLAYIKLLKGKGETVVSSTQISKVLSIEASQVVKDLSFVKIGGKTRVGY